MFDIAPSELLLVAFIALVVIGPKDLPKAMRVVGYWVGRARAVGRQFRSGFDEMVREAELEEMEKKWKAENERIMREHPASGVPALPDPVVVEGDVIASKPLHAATPDSAAPDTAAPPNTPSETAQPALPFDESDHPVMVEKPHVAPAPDTATAITPDKTPS